MLAGAAVAVVIAFFWLGGPAYLDLQTVRTHRDMLLQWTLQHRAAALLAAFAVYVATVTFSLPGAAVLSLTAGFLFGRWVGLALTVSAATVGATLVFLGARFLFEDSARARLGRWYAALRKGFQRNAFSYLLFLRLVPLFPFFAVNLAGALGGVPLRTYVAATLIGILPGSFVFVNLGEALGQITSTRDLVAPRTLLALTLLGVLALVPVVWRRWRGRADADDENARRA